MTPFKLNSIEEAIEEIAKGNIERSKQSKEAMTRLAQIIKERRGK